MSLKIVTVCTKDQPHLPNWIRSLNKLKYDYTILGYDEKWGGWPWRTQKYIDFCHKQDKDTIVVISDANDLLFLASPHELLNKFRSRMINNKCDYRVVYGAETHCCTDKYQKDKKLRNYAVETCKKRIKSRHRFVNGGFSIGYAHDLANLLEKVKDYQDDQAGLLELWLENEYLFSLDTEQELCANIPDDNYFHRVDNEDNNYDEISYWQYKHGRLIHLKTKVKPCVIHFPGSKTTKKSNYANIGYKMMGDHFTATDEDHTLFIVLGSFIVIIIILILVFSFSRSSKD